MSSTCYFCKTAIVHSMQNGAVMWCSCGSLGIDKTDHYVRYLGSIPEEDLTTEQKETYTEILKRFNKN